MIGFSVYNRHLQYLRDVLLEEDEDTAANWVNYGWASKPDTFHGIAFEGNRQTAQFQVRLFGLLAYTVRFPNIRIDFSPTLYIHQIDTGEDWVRLPD